MRLDEYQTHDATALAACVARGDVSAGKLLALAQAQLDQVQPRLNAVVRPMPEQAAAQLRGTLTGPLAGVPLLIKDGVQDYAGVPTGAGSRAFQRWPAPAHSAIVRRLLQSGAVIFGKTNLPELGLKGVTDPLVHGPCRNPWDPARTPGGSSGGSAAAVAAGVLPMATGNDGGGSLRIPAACCGLFALKPSRGRVSVGPGLGEMWFGLSQDGVLSRSVRDTALALDILAGPEPGDPFQIAAPTTSWRALAQEPPGRLVIAVQRTSPIGTHVHTEAIAAVDRTAALLTQLGHEVVEKAPEIDGWALVHAYLRIYFGTVPASVDAAVARGARESEFEPLTRITAALGRSMSGALLASALQEVNTFARLLGQFFQQHDLLLTPTLAEPPRYLGAGDNPGWQTALLMGLRHLRLLGAVGHLGLTARAIDGIAQRHLSATPFTQLANITGVPAMSVPLHWTSEGLPLGVQFVAPSGGEARLLQLATQLEAASPWFDRLPDWVRPVRAEVAG